MMIYEEKYYIRLSKFKKFIITSFFKYIEI